VRLEGRVEGVDAVALVDELLLRQGVVHEDDVGGRRAAQIARLAGADGNDADLHPLFCSKIRKIGKIGKIGRIYRNEPARPGLRGRSLSPLRRDSVAGTAAPQSAQRWRRL
jgi:hypothetical protein